MICQRISCHKEGICWWLNSRFPQKQSPGTQPSRQRIWHPAGSKCWKNVSRFPWARHLGVSESKYIWMYLGASICTMHATVWTHQLMSFGSNSSSSWASSSASSSSYSDNRLAVSNLVWNFANNSSVTASRSDPFFKLFFCCSLYFFRFSSNSFIASFTGTLFPSEQTYIIIKTAD